MRAKAVLTQRRQTAANRVIKPDHDLLASRITTELSRVGNFAGYTNEEYLSLLMPFSFYPGSGQLHQYIKWTQIFFLKEELGWPVREIIEESRENGGPVW